MKKIDSFKVNHLILKPGVYFSREDDVNGTKVQTWDIRITRPYYEPVIPIEAVHALEHLLATFCRNDECYGKDIIYVGPGSCCTMMYIVTFNMTSEDVITLLRAAFSYVSHYEGQIPGATPVECGACYLMDLDCAKQYAEQFFNRVLKTITPQNMVYETE